MGTKDLQDIKETLVYLWDFFTTNTDGDETGLVEEIQEKYSKSLKKVRSELSKNYLNSEVKKILRKEGKL